MNTMLKIILGLILFILPGCEKDMGIKSYLDPIESDKFYSEEIVPRDYQPIYGKWRLSRISGGISGAGYENNFDYLHIKSVGIYGLIRNDSLLEYGKIELDTFDTNYTDLLQIKLIPYYYIGQGPHMYPPEKYIDLMGNDTMNLNSPCCDMYNYHFERINQIRNPPQKIAI